MRLQKDGVEVIAHPTKIDELTRKGFTPVETPVDPEPDNGTEEVIEDGDA